VKDTTTLRVVRTRLDLHNNTVEATLVRTIRQDGEDDSIYVITLPSTLALGLGIYPERELTLTMSDQVTV
jgi:hypothetical protein